MNLNVRAKKQNTYDAIVVGSGISGGWAAMELTEKGLRTLVLERGRNVEHIKDYPNATKGPWEYPHRGGRTKAMEEAYPVLKRDYPLNEKNLEFWASDKDSPYTEVKRFDWYRGYQVGGRSLMWGRQSYRFADLDFEANAREGVGVESRATVRIAGIRTRDTVRVSMWEPPRILVIDHLGWVKGTGEIQLQPVSEGTRMRWRETLFPPPKLGPVGRLGLRMMSPLMRRTFRRDLRVLRSLVGLRSRGG
jgi:choline dehydrogenase-like flavoprotein